MYTEKEFLDMILDLKQDMQELKTDMQIMSRELKNTCEQVKKYNGLRQRVDSLEFASLGVSRASKGIREWLGWGVALLVGLGHLFTLVKGG